jgi:hypothetical protein
MKCCFSRYFLLFASFLVVACGANNNKSELLHQLSPVTYSDVLNIEGTVEAVRSKTVFCPNNIDGTIVYLIEDGTLVEKGEVICVLENRELTKYYEDLLKQVESTTAEYSKSKANLDMQYAILEAQVKSNEAQTSITNLDSAQLQYASPVQQKIRKIEMEMAAIEKAKIEKKLSFLKTINESELKKIGLQIKRDSTRAASINTMMKEMTIKAPERGLALRSFSPMRDGKIAEGDQTWSEIPLINIPDLTEVKVNIFATETEYKRIELNNKVTYTFNGMPGNKAYGKIIQKAPMGKPLSRNSKVKYFEITASVDSFEVIPEPGISANCIVTVKEVADTIVVPQLAIFEEDSSKFVFVKVNNSFEKREVRLGENSPKQAVITAGLKGDELIALAYPVLSKISKKVALLTDSLDKKSISTENGLSTQTQNQIK